MYDQLQIINKANGNATNTAQTLATTFFTALEVAAADLLIIAPDSAIRCFITTGHTPTGAIGIFVEGNKNSYLYGRSLIGGFSFIRIGGSDIPVTFLLLKNPTSM